MKRRSFADNATGSWDPCTFDGCGRRSRRAGWCWGHVKQRWRGDMLRPLRELSEPIDRLRRAAQAWVDAETETDFRRADYNLGHAAMVYARSLQR